MALILSAEIDFLGVNYYVPRRVKAREGEYDLDYFTPEYYFENAVNPQGRFNPYRDNNEILPQAIYDIAANIRDNYGNIKWYLAEIGIAMDRQSEGEPGADGVIDDNFRIQLMEEHLVQLHRAIADGANCFGVHQWTFYRQLVVDQCLQTALRLLATGSGYRRATDKTQCAVVLPNWRPATVLPATNSALRQRSLLAARKEGACEATPVRLYLMPSRFMRDRSVVRFSPSRWAAPFGPATTPLLSFSTRTIS